MIVKIIRFIDKIIEGAAVLAFASSSLLILLNVMNRYLVSGLMRNLAKDNENFTPVYLFFREHLGSLSVMADEVPGLLLVWIAFLGAYLVLRREGHISFDMIAESLSLRGQKILIATNAALFGGLLLVMLVQSVRMIKVSGATEIETAEVAQGWFMLVLPISAALFLLALAQRTYNQLMAEEDDK